MYKFSFQLILFILIWTDGIAQHDFSVYEVVTEFQRGLYAKRDLNVHMWKKRFEAHSFDTFGIRCDLPLTAFSAKAEDRLLKNDFSFFVRHKLEAEHQEHLKVSYINGWMQSRDPYAELYDEHTSRFLSISRKGTYFGIGVVWANDRTSDGNLLVSEVIEGGPAEMAGLLKGAEVQGISIDNVDLKLEEVNTKVIGTKISSALTTTIYSNDRSFIVVPENIKIPEFRNEVLIDNGKIILKLRSISEDSYECTLAAIDMAKTNNSSELIMDLRDNTGGLTHKALQIIGAFRGRGTTGIKWKYLDSWKRHRCKNLNSNTEQIYFDNLTVIVNENTASAAEIISLSLGQIEGFQIIGGQTFGKLCSQDLISLNRGYSMKYTVSEFGVE